MMAIRENVRHERWLIDTNICGGEFAKVGSLTMRTIIHELLATKRLPLRPAFFNFNTLYNKATFSKPNKTASITIHLCPQDVFHNTPILQMRPHTTSIQWNLQLSVGHLIIIRMSLDSSQVSVALITKGFAGRQGTFLMIGFFVAVNTAN